MQPFRKTVLGVLVLGYVIGFGICATAQPFEWTFGVSAGANVSKGTSNVIHYTLSAWSSLSLWTDRMSAHSSVAVCPSRDCDNPVRLVSSGMSFTLIDSSVWKLTTAGGITLETSDYSWQYYTSSSLTYSLDGWFFSVSGSYDKELASDWYYQAVSLGVGHDFGTFRLSGSLEFGWNWTGTDVGIGLGASWKDL